MIKNHDRFKNICSGIQNITIACAVIVGGFWTAYIFNVQLQVENAKAHLAKLNRDLEERASMHITLRVKNIDTKNKSEVLKKIFVEISNHGERATILNFKGEAPLRVRKVDLKDGKLIAVGEPIFAWPHRVNTKGELVPYSNLIVAPGDQDTLTHLISLPISGVYLVHFAALGSEKDIESAAKASGYFREKLLWTASDYIQVE